MDESFCGVVVGKIRKAHILSVDMMNQLLLSNAYSNELEPNNAFKNLSLTPTLVS